MLYNGVNLNGKDGTALEDFIQNNPLDHHYITIVVPDAGQAEDGETQNAIQYGDIAGNKTAGLCKYELSDEEWQITEQLHNMLKAHVCSYFLVP